MAWPVLRTVSIEFEDDATALDPELLQQQVVELQTRCDALEQKVVGLEELARLGQAAEHVGDSIEFTDTEGTLRYVNPAYTRLTGYHRHEAIGRTPAELIRSDAHDDAFYEAIWQRTATGASWKGRITSRHRNGSRFVADCTISAVIDGDGDVVAYMCLRRDVTDQVAREEELQASLSRFALAAAGATDGMWGWNLQTGELLLSSRWRQMLGYPALEHRTDLEHWLDLVHPDDRAALRAELQLHVDRQSAHVECDYRIRHRDGSWRWMMCRGLAEVDGLGRPLLVAGSQSDITKRKVAELRLRHEALHDTLTGLPNRALFDERLGAAMERRAQDPSRRVAVMFLDLDRFKNVNDSLGHAAGDRLLCEIAGRLRRAVRQVDTVARLGGDEFTLLLEGLREERVLEAAERIQAAVREPVRLSGADLVVSPSLGLVFAGPEHASSDDLLRDADTAMYRAKARGRACTVVFRPEMRQELVNRVRVEQRLRTAIEAGDLLLHYQPIYGLPDLEMCGVEALVRWRRDGEIVPPEGFLAVAREAGLMDRVESWVLEEALDQAARWRAAGRDVVLNVNVSPERLLSHDMAAHVRRNLASRELEGSALRLEITESSLLADQDRVAQVLAELRALGVRICLDDFGTGYSALAYVNRFPVDVVKIDRSFIADLLTRPQAEAIVRAILGMAQGLGLQVVAEGVETEDQLARLVELGCHRAQGFLMGRPCAADLAVP